MGKALGGRPFDKATLYMLLKNSIFIGKIKHKEQVYAGEHEAIIGQDMFDQVQSLLANNGRTGGAAVRNRYGALLRGLLRCKSCEHAMTHTFAGGRNGQFYRYYRCVRAIKSGSEVCPSGTLPAQEIERVVVDEVRALAADKSLLAQVLTEAQATITGELSALAKEREDLNREAARHHQELRRLAVDGTATSEVTARIADLHERISDAEQRRPELDSRIAEFERETVSRVEAEAAFADFDTLWNNLIPREQARLLNLLISAVEYDAERGSMAVTFRPTSIRALIDHRVHGLEDAA